MSGVPGSIASMSRAPAALIDCEDGRGVKASPPLERGSLVRHARPVWADLQDGPTPGAQPAPDNDRHAPARNEGVEVHLPTLRKNAQGGGQLVKPRADFVSEPSSETSTDFIVDPGSGRAHLPTVAQPQPPIYRLASVRERLSTRRTTRARGRPGRLVPRASRYSSNRSTERSTQCQPGRSHAPARFSGCPTTGGGRASRRDSKSAGGTRMTHACSRRERSAGATP